MRFSFITQFKIEFLLPFTSCRKVLGKMPEMLRKGCTHLYNLAVEKCAGLCKIVRHFGTTCHKRANEIHVHGYALGPARSYQKYNKKACTSLLTYFLTYFLFTLHDMYYYIYKNYYWISLLRLNGPPVWYSFYPLVLPKWRVLAFVNFIVAGLYKKLN